MAREDINGFAEAIGGGGIPNPYYRWTHDTGDDWEWVNRGTVMCLRNITDARDDLCADASGNVTIAGQPSLANTWIDQDGGLWHDEAANFWIYQNTG